MKAQSLIKDLFANADHESLKSFLEIQCGFTEDEADSWITEADELLKQKAKPFASMIADTLGWIAVSDRLPTTEDASPLLVVCLKPFMGKFDAQIRIGYFDSPEGYQNPGMAEGWKDWQTEESLLVTHWQNCPELPQSEFKGMEQIEFHKRFRSILGSVQ